MKRAVVTANVELPVRVASQLYGTGNFGGGTGNFRTEKLGPSSLQNLNPRCLRIPWLRVRGVNWHIDTISLILQPLHSE